MCEGEVQNGPYILFSVVPLPSTTVFDFYLPSFYSEFTLYRGCQLAYPYDWRGFVGTKKKTSVGLLVLFSCEVTLIGFILEKGYSNS
jgi:hypothetical protein